MDSKHGGGWVEWESKGHDYTLSASHFQILGWKVKTTVLKCVHVVMPLFDTPVRLVSYGSTQVCFYTRTEAVYWLVFSKSCPVIDLGHNCRSSGNWYMVNVAMLTFSQGLLCICMDNGDSGFLCAGNTGIFHVSTHFQGISMHGWEKDDRVAEDSGPSSIMCHLDSAHHPLCASTNHL